MCICSFEFLNIEYFHFCCGENVKSSKTVCNYTYKYLQYLTNMLSTTNLLSDQPGATRIYIYELGMWDTNKFWIQNCHQLTFRCHSNSSWSQWKNIFEC